MDAVGEAVVVVGIDVAVVDRGEGVAASENFFDRPPRAAGATGSFVGAVVFNAPILAVVHPVAGDRDAGIGVDGMVAYEVDSQECGHRAVSVLGEVNQQVRLGGFLIAGKSDEHFAPDRLAVQCGGIVLYNLELEFVWLARAPAVNMFAEKFEHFRSPFIDPAAG